jgi:hypothetical protein
MQKQTAMQESAATLRFRGALPKAWGPFDLGQAIGGRRGDAERGRQGEGETRGWQSFDKWH